MEDSFPEAGVVAVVTVGAGAKVAGPEGKKTSIMSNWSFKASMRRAGNLCCKIYFWQVEKLALGEPATHLDSDRMAWYLLV